ncbi:MOSC domain-containing protein [Actinomycetospora lutea]|uniref:MOSC domain-containing protein n=1 Tax=Actinomycetospora lutea TaxID=663604 RepID=UPI00236723D9|nr:MOSC N-terminal beta barrel domain-containing protein [Actinomycetospora lutea]MDD7939227.1 MOSC domain-containing protein [Actinomycetospora lutea]
MQITALWRYPVKSMLGEPLEGSRVDAGGLEGDRALALLDDETGTVATAKHPRRWRELLRYAAVTEDGQIRITSPAGWTRDALDPWVAGALADELGRPVRVAPQRPAGAEVERPDPEDVLDQGVEAEVAAPTLEIAQGTTGGSFVDHSPVHLITTATLDAIGTEYRRYRPNVVIETPEGTPPWVENTWMGRELTLTAADGTTVTLEVSLPTPRCSVPTLEHGTLPRAPHAVREPMRANRVEVPGFGVLPCAGAYAQVTSGGTLRVGDTVTLAG